MNISANVSCADRLRLGNRLTDRKGWLYWLCSYSQIKKDIHRYLAVNDALVLNIDDTIGRYKCVNQSFVSLGRSLEQT